MIGVEMRDENALHVDQADRAKQLALCPFAAIEQQAIASAAHQQGRQASPGARHRTAGAQEEERQVHGGYGTEAGPFPHASRHATRGAGRRGPLRIPAAGRPQTESLQNRSPSAPPPGVATTFRWTFWR